MKVQYDLSEAMGAPLKAAGAFRLKLVSFEEHDENDAMWARWEAKNGDGLKDYVGLSGKAAFKLQQYVEMLLPRTSLKEEGTLDLSKMIGKEADVLVVYDEEYENYKIKDVSKKGTLETVDYLKTLTKGSTATDDADDLDDEDIDLDDDLEEEEEKPKKKTKKKTKTKKKAAPEPEELDEDDFDDEDEEEEVKPKKKKTKAKPKKKPKKVEVEPEEDDEDEDWDDLDDWDDED